MILNQPQGSVPMSDKMSYHMVCTVNIDFLFRSFWPACIIRSYPCNAISYTGKMISIYWISPRTQFRCPIRCLNIWWGIDVGDMRILGNLFCFAGTTSKELSVATRNVWMARPSSSQEPTVVWARNSRRIWPGEVGTTTSRWIDSLWPKDAIWHLRTWSTLVQVMACCLMAPSHYLNQCWLIICEVVWHYKKCSWINPQHVFKLQS